MAGIELRQITKRYTPRGPLVIQGVDIRVPEGSLTTLLGPSGCGKTTLLRMIAGLDSPTSGQILIDGREVTGQGPAERNISMVFQGYALFPHMTVIGNVGYGLSVSGVKPAQIAERAAAALRLVGLSGLEARMPGELSGGQQQRVAVARALVLEPSVMLFDEPLSNLDARLRRTMRQEIRELQQRLGLTVVYVTHDQSEALAISDQVVVMNTGVVAQAGSPSELYERPTSAFVAGFMGEAMLFDGFALNEHEVTIGPVHCAIRHQAPAGAVKVAVRPQAWEIQATGAGLAATVSNVAYLGSHWELGFATELGPVLVISGDPGHPWRPGDRAVLNLRLPGVSVVTA